MKQIMYCLIIIASVLSFSTAFADGKSGTYTLKQLDPDVRKVIMKAIGKIDELKKDGKVMTRVSTSDCPSTCNGEVHGGLCYCDRKDGKCPEGQDETTWGGEEKCSTKPTTENLTGGGLKPQLIKLSF